MITENISTLKIHKLTQAQYDRELDAGRIDENALYLTPYEYEITPIENGGTGATDGATGLANLFAAGDTVLSSYQYGDTLPEAGIAGRIFFKRVSE